MRVILKLGGLWGRQTRRNGKGSVAKERARTVAEMVEQVRQAQGDWEIAKQYFQCATEPDRVDHAIFSLQAAERKYMFLLNELKARSQAGGEQRWS